MPNRPIPDAAEFRRLLEQARGSSAAALGRLWWHCRDYLLLVAAKNIDPQLTGKVSPSDVVQETFLEAQRDFGRFEGTSEEELRAWLTRILLNNLANASRQFTGTQKRAVRREVPLPAVPLDDLPHGPATGPQEAMDREQAERVRRAMQGLPEHYRTVLELRYEQDLTFEQIAAVINRSAEATRKLWARAVTSLQQQLATGDAT